jgi:hypothetical protein
MDRSSNFYHKRYNNNVQWKHHIYVLTEGLN